MHIWPTRPAGVEIADAIAMPVRPDALIALGPKDQDGPLAVRYEGDEARESPRSQHGAREPGNRVGSGQPQPPGLQNLDLPRTQCHPRRLRRRKHHEPANADCARPEVAADPETWREPRVTVTAGLPTQCGRWVRLLQRVHGRTAQVVLRERDRSRAPPAPQEPHPRCIAVAMDRQPALMRRQPDCSTCA